MNILLIEDEPLVARNLQKMVQELEPAAQVLAVLDSVAASLAWFRQQPQPDLVLADIQLSDGISFNIFSQVEVAAPIIFTTAYDEYALKAFKLNSVDYLLKPIDKAELQKALQKYKKLENTHLLSEQLKQLLGSTATAGKKYKERFLVTQRNIMVPVEVDDIACFHKEELIYLHTFGNERFIAEYATLDEIQELLNPAHFFRANRQYLIHIHTIDRIRSTYKGLTVHLKQPLNQEIDISREKAAIFKEWLSK
ncbi:LytTR family DNA-binding domain-containing protein [Cesiribacter sp. SM1]|uniref:LytR/AlgR family response regulator transcription factor n=1 Tax=Cesiribacter sp. SM1 TaxID=2861196 RepID=UPI001CD55EAE|nr:LytTR family DNA-binding domain-containing protein [Cesiribacter sp. SM1]